MTREEKYIDEKEFYDTELLVFNGHKPLKRVQLKDVLRDYSRELFVEVFGWNHEKTFKNKFNRHQEMIGVFDAYLEDFFINNKEQEIEEDL